MSDYYNDRVIWITGASSGIGEACAREFAKRGAKVALSARSEDELSRIASEIGGENTMVVSLDVTDHDANHAAANQIVERWGRIDTAFFNAGFWEAMDLKDFDVALFRKTFEVNYFGMLNGINAVLAKLMDSDRPHLVGMASSVAYRGMPRAEAYCSSKAAVRSMLQGLRAQLLEHNVPVTIILPGFVKSKLTDKNDFDMPFIMESEKAAQIIADGMARYKSEIAFPKRFIAMMKFLTALPDAAYTKMMAKRIA